VEDWNPCSKSRRAYAIHSVSDKSRRQRWIWFSIASKCRKHLKRCRKQFLGISSLVSWVKSPRNACNKAQGWRSTQNVQGPVVARRRRPCEGTCSVAWCQTMESHIGALARSHWKAMPRKVRWYAFSAYIICLLHMHLNALRVSFLVVSFPQALLASCSIASQMAQSFESLC